MRKKQYEKPQIEEIIFMTEDILTTSSGDDDKNQGEWDELAVFP